MLLSYTFDLILKYEVKFHNSKSQPHMAWLAAPSSVTLLIRQLPSWLKASFSLLFQWFHPAVCGWCHCTHVLHKPQAKCRRDPLPGVDSTVDPHCFFVGFIISRQLRKRFLKSLKNLSNFVCETLWMFIYDFIHGGWIPLERRVVAFHLRSQ